MLTGHAILADCRAAGATAPGDIIIGGLFPIHGEVEVPADLSVPRPTQCVNFNKDGFIKALTMIHAVESVNKSPVLTELGISLGYQIYDSCSDVTTALRATAEFTGVTTVSEGGANASNCPLPIKAVIGASYSEVTIAVARHLNLQLIPQISYASTAIILSDKFRFPAFLRTVPSDLYQTQAMVQLLSNNDWTWVGVVTTDGDYGRSALDSFISHATASEICVAFKEILPDSLTSPNMISAIRQAAATIRNQTKVKVVVSFAKPTHMMYLYHELKGWGPGSELSERVWVASDNWSSSKDVLGNIDQLDISHVVGFTFRRGDLASFYSYLMSLSDRPDIEQNNSFLKEFYSLQNGSTGTAAENLKNSTNADQVLSVGMAVSAVAHAVADICSNRSCKTPGTLQPWKVLKALKGSAFEHNGKSYMFDMKGDINLGYDVTLWSAVRGVFHDHGVVAEYHTINDSFSYSSEETKKLLSDLMKLESKCSPACEPGKFKKTAEGQHTCCYECTNCTENHYSNNTDMDSCLSCDTEIEWSLAGSKMCTPKTLEFFSWQDGFAVVLLTLAAVGIILVLLVGALFQRHHQTPVVKAAGGPLSQLILLSLVGSFVSAVFFVGHASSLQCKVRQVLFGLSFTLCVSCILVKSLTILMAFQLNPDLKNVFHRFYQPYVFICFCLAIQVLICTLWLVLASPRERTTVLLTTLLAECDEGSYVAFGMMLGYIAILAIVCFVCAFKGRKLPQKYNEAMFITFGMLLYFISWVIFVPIYVTTSGKYLPAVEMVIILMSNYGILSCHFFPKCYIILLKKEHNTESAFMKNVYEYSSKGIIDSSHVCGSSVSQTVEKCTSYPYSISSPSCFMSLPPIEPAAPQNGWTLGQDIQCINKSTQPRVFFTGQLNQTYHVKRSMSL
ncbi:G-protein coupled receptor family C group 6 member A [Esox lucius]|uniref:G-protein coupled receptor family C group 6 member A n=1 Tax=Esox lucius TaxID=8010 RepID=UPI001476AB1E|nr:G-protein coupled receptor family C group 6 member A [Esox lucius]